MKTWRLRMKLLKATNKILIVGLILRAHALPVPIQDCLMASLRRIDLGQLGGKTPMVILAGRIVVAHLIFSMSFLFCSISVCSLSLCSATLRAVSVDAACWM